MTPEKAIEIIKIAKAEVEWEYPLDYQIAFDVAIEALENQEKYKWHKAKKESPKETKEYLIYYRRWSNIVDAWVEDIDIRRYFTGLGRFDVWNGEKRSKVIAWREIEPFKESDEE